MRFRVVIITLIVPLTVACAERRPSGPSAGDGSSVSPSESVPPPVLFPHPDGWGEPVSHGGWVVQYSVTPCLRCHDASSDKTKPPACSGCHPLYPHASDWAKKENHGTKVLNEGRAVCATQCHGPDLQGGLSGLSCDRCHAIYPHSIDWVAPDKHGRTAEGTGRSICKACHGDDLLGGASGVSCRRCHGIYPHSDGWGPPSNQHGTEVKASGSTGCATTCHGTDLKGGLSGVGCDSCHQVYPHSNTWETEHGASVMTLGTGACQGCHGDNLRTLLDGKNCFSCHQDYPHAAPSSWIPFAGGHGETLKTTYRGNTASCERCHGADLRTVKPDGKNCFSCHPSYPHEKMVGGPWREYGGHGAYALPPAKKPECQLCHGSDFRGGGRGNRSCFDAACHVSYPHSSGWRDTGHGPYVQTNNTDSCKNEYCHGVNLVPRPGITNGPACSPGCHETYPHAANWSPPLTPPAPSLHGPVARGSIATCKVCHGDGLNVAPPESETCRACHPSYLLHGSAAIPGTAPWGGFIGHGTFLRNKPTRWDATECKVCHGDDFSGGVSLVGCSDIACHASYPQRHTTPWKRTGTHGTYVHGDLSDDLTPCKKCHGTNLTGGNTEKSCLTCHPGYPHTEIRNWPTTAHGAAALTPTGRNGCKDCHGADLRTVKGGKTCFTCHTEFPHSPAWMVRQTETVLVDRECCDPDDETRCWSCPVSTTINHLYLHGQRFVEQKTAAFPDTPNRCSNCHGADYSTVLNGNSCMTCHNDYPHVKYVNWVSRDLSATPLGGQHAVSFLGGPRDASSPCTHCHLNFGAGPSAIGVPGAAASACSSCHTYPHLRTSTSPDSWIYRSGSRTLETTNHGFLLVVFASYHESRSRPPNPCEACHGPDLMGGSGLAQESKRCSRCHTTGVVSHSFPNWRPASGHGRNYIRARLAGFPAGSPDRCQDCHPADLGRNPTRVCNPFTTEFPASGNDWCSTCHVPSPPVPATCPCPGMNSTTGVCP